MLSCNKPHTEWWDIPK